MGETKLVTKLLDNEKFRSKIRDHDINFSLCLASANGQLKIINKFITLKAELNMADQNGKTPLYYAAKNGHLSAVKLLQKNDASHYPTHTSINPINLPLYVAVKNGYENIVEHLIKNGASERLYSHSSVPAEVQ